MSDTFRALVEFGEEGSVEAYVTDLESRLSAVTEAVRGLIEQWQQSAVRLEREADAAPASVVSKAGREARRLRASEKRTCADDLAAALKGAGE